MIVRSTVRIVRYDGHSMDETQPKDGSAIAEVVAANLRRFRAQSEMSLGELARKAGVSKSTVSALESGTGNPSIETLWALGVALGVPFGQLVSAPATPVRVIRAGEGARVGSARDAGYAVRLLASTAQRSARDIYVLEAEPGRPRAAEPHVPGTIEHAVCAAGRMRLGPRGQEVELAVGDYASFAGDVLHSYEALEHATRLMLVMDYP
jgi:transcriptional regulator with XRE-family HTH domain